MKLFSRIAQIKVEEYISKDVNKILFIWGPRRSGKTTLLENISSKYNFKLFNFDSITDREKFTPKREDLAKLVNENKIILIDEVQSYPESTIALKLLHDEFGVKIIATGSSELRKKSQEFDSLAGRYTEIYCLPLSLAEIYENEKPKGSDEPDFFKELQKDIQIFGSYPEIYINNNLGEVDKIKNLQKILDTYVLKDIIDIYELKNQRLAKNILEKIALQLGSEVSVREIASSLGTNAVTVANYIEIFIKNYVLIPLPGFKTNVRRAVSENRKLYFYDLGIRNVLIQDFRDLNLRPDQGGLFENFIILEIEKHRKNMGLLNNLYFYREYGGKEVDLIIEDYKKNYKAIEIKAKKGKLNIIFPIKHDSMPINEDNYFEEIEKI